jgi:hypothetical protein
MDVSILDAIVVDEFVHLSAVIGIVAQCVENLGEANLREMIRYLFRADANTPQFDDRADWHPR